MSKDKNLDDLISEWEARAERGEPVDFLQLSGNNPGLARQLEQVISLLSESSWMNRTPTDLLFHDKDGSTRTPVGSIDFASLPLNQLLVADGFQVGDIIDGRYRLVHIIGEGGSAYVWLANDLVLGRLVAVKALKRVVLTESSVQLFLSEAQLMARFEHPAILPIYDQINIEGRVFLVLKYVPRGNHFSPMDYRLAVKIILQVCEALKFLHSNKVLHCDIKTSNILVDPTGHAYLTDYGVAIDERLDNQIQTAGTKGYMAPERLAGLKNSQQTDIFSLGVVLRQLLTGVPTDSGEMQTLGLSELLPAGIRKILDKATSTALKDRYQTIEEMSDSLRNVLAKGDKRKPYAKLSLFGGVIMALLLISVVFLIPAGNSFKVASQIKLISNEQYKIMTGDWDGDSDFDLATSNTHNRTDIFLNDGKGSLQFLNSFNREHPISDSSSAKFSGERKNLLIQCVEHEPVVYISDFDGVRFIPRIADRFVSLLKPVYPNLIDLDNDGLSDLVCLDRDTNDISIRFADSDTSFASDIIFSATDNVEDRPTHAFFADFNQDKKLDILIPFQSQPNRSGITILFQTSDQEFTESSTFNIDGNALVGVGCLSDYDTDGDMDFILPDTRGNRIIGFQNDGKGNLGKYSTLLKSEKPTKLIPIDSSYRNFMDYALISEKYGFSLVGPDSNEYWQKFEQYELLPTNDGIISIDLDNDGTMEIIARNRNDDVAYIFKRKR